MAITATATNVSTSGFAPVKRAFSAFLRFFVLIGEANSHVREIQALQALSDAQLKERGLKREDIAQHVLGSTYFF